MSLATHRYPWRTFAFLSAAGTLTGPLIIPYAQELQAHASVPSALSTMPPEAIVALVLARNLAFLVPAAGLGLLVARKVGLGAPYLESRLDGAEPPAEPWSSIVRPAFAVDLIVHVVRPPAERALA